MTPPPLLMGAALLFWGWQTGFLLWGMLMAVIIEGARVVPGRWELSARHFYRIADASALLFLAMMIYRFVAGTASMARWLPLALFPLLAAQGYSTVGRVDLGAIFYTIRQREKKRPGTPRRGVDIGYPCIALTVLAASAANVRTPVFYLGLTVMTGWALWPLRPKRSPIVFLMLLLAAALGGYFFGTGLHTAQQRLEAWAEQQYPAPRSVSRNVTALGDVGRLKQYDHIVMRVWPLGASKPPRLLHEASFNHFSTTTWVASHTRFSPLVPGNAHGDAWHLSGAPAMPSPGVEIALRLDDEDGVLSLPAGTVLIERLPATRLERSTYGTVRATGAPPLVRFRAAGRPSEGVLESAPGEEDLNIPKNEVTAVKKMLAALDLEDRTPAEKAEAIRRRFHEQFTYSLEQPAPARGRTPLSHFLEVSHSGHCEFFASATVLLLRAAGIPARYATGYAVGEYSPLEKCMVVRARHSHAWALAYIDGRWLPVDSTPPIWMAEEAARLSTLRPVMDLLRWAGYHLSQWRLTAPKDFKRPQWLWWVIAVAAALVGWWARQRLIKPGRQRAAGGASETRPSQPKPVAALEQLLAESGWPRPAWEPHGEWAARLSASGCMSTAAQALQNIMARYDRLRFHPDSLSSGERASLTRDIADLMDGIRKHPPEKPGPQ